MLAGAWLWSGAVRTRIAWRLLAAGIPALLLLALPVVALVLRAFASGTVLAAFDVPAVLDALWLSAITTGVTVVLVVLLGLPLS